MMDVKIQKVLDAIHAPEVRKGAEEAVSLMEGGGDASQKARQTYVALARFGTALDDDHKVKPRYTAPDENADDALKSVIKQAGITYFGPMFRDGGENTPLHSKDRILSEMAKRGYHTKPLAHLTDIQLDMLYTKTLESGLLTDFANRQPSH
jgi:hypothetical protein